MESMDPETIVKHDGLPKRFLILSEGKMKLFGPKKIYDIYIFILYIYIYIIYIYLYIIYIYIIYNIYIYRRPPCH